MFKVTQITSPDFTFVELMCTLSRYVVTMSSFNGDFAFISEKTNVIYAVHTMWGCEFEILYSLVERVAFSSISFSIFIVS
jgi:hypothetical protein